MSIGLRHSTIEFARKREHGSDFLKLYRTHTDGESLVFLLTITRGFLLHRNPDTSEGAAGHFLTIDAAYTAGLNTEVMDVASIAILQNASGSEKRRFRFDTQTPPTLEDYRYVCGMFQETNNAQPILP